MQQHLVLLFAECCTLMLASASSLRPFLAGSAFIARFQDPNNCTGHEYSVVEAGFGGGFASQFQVVAAEWLKAAAGHNYSLPVLIRGHLRGYSDGKECSHVNKDWTCLFLPMSACQDTLLQHGRRVEWAPGTGKVVLDASIVPPEFRAKGLAWWWGTVQAYMFRLQPAVERYIHDELAHMNKSFPALGSPVAGLHVRHGDKASDGFKHQSFEAELRAVRKSPDCVQVVAATANNNNSSSTDGEISNVGDGGANVCMTHAGGGRTNATATDPLAPLKVFVASDDANVLVAAKKMGHLADSSGVSQQTSTKGMFATMLARPDIGYNASLEIITDIYFLSRCTTLVGIAASQVFRVAVGISNATGLLRAAITMDHDQTPRIKRMSEKFGLPFPETFINARGVRRW